MDISTHTADHKFVGNHFTPAYQQRVLDVVEYVGIEAAAKKLMLTPARVYNMVAYARRQRQQEAAQAAQKLMHTLMHTGSDARQQVASLPSGDVQQDLLKP